MSVERTAKIKLISVESEKVKEYYKLTVTYKNLDTGKIEVKPMLTSTKPPKRPTIPCLRLTRSLSGLLAS